MGYGLANIVAGTSGGTGVGGTGGVATLDALIATLGLLRVTFVGRYRGPRDSNARSGESYIT
jgi:hypothetical protein